MDWNKFTKAKIIDDKLTLINDILNYKVCCETVSTFWDAYSFLMNRADFKEYLKGVSCQLKEEFNKL